MDKFRREVCLEDGKNPIVCLKQELGRLGKDVWLEVGSLVTTAESDSNTSKSTKKVNRLRQWNSRWDCFVDLMDTSQILDGDKLIAMCMRGCSNKTPDHQFFHQQLP